MGKLSLKYKLYWLVSVLLLTMLIFLGYSEIKYSGNNFSTFDPNQKDSLKLDSPAFFLSDSATPSQDSKAKSESDETSSSNYVLEIRDILLNPTLVYPPNDNSKQVDSNERKTGADKEADKQGNTSIKTVAISNTTEENSILPTRDDIFWVNFFMKVNSAPNNSSAAKREATNLGNQNKMDYTSIGSGNNFKQVKMNSVNNTQRITQIGINNYASQTLLNTVNSELIVRSIGNYNSVFQKTFDASDTRIIAIQNGNLNMVNISQEGSKNSATVRQSGSGNSVSIEQH